MWQDGVVSKPKGVELLTLKALGHSLLVWGFRWSKGCLESFGKGTKVKSYGVKKCELKEEMRSGERDGLAHR